MSFRTQMRYLNPYDLHKLLINEYVLKRPGDRLLLTRDTSKDKTDYDVLRENHKFLWDEETPDTWEAQFAKKYYDKLFKEYCIGDLTLYKENKIALRWRTEAEVIKGKGQFICGSRKCNIENDLKTWEVNFAYREQGEKKNALVKIRLCPECSTKLNYRSKKREVKRLNRQSKSKHKKNKDKSKSEDDEDSDKMHVPSTSHFDVDEHKLSEESPWQSQKPVDSKTREEEMEEYLEDLLL